MPKLNYFLLFSFIITFNFAVHSQTNIQEIASLKVTRIFINEIINESFPEIDADKIELKIFHSQKNYFKARFSIKRYLTFQKMQYVVYVNPKAFPLELSETAFKSILAHELAHILYYTEKNRLELLGLTRLVSGSFTTKFERRADLEAIERGYGEGLVEYRKWLYQNIPNDEIEAKKKDYFSPEEIELILELSEKNPVMFEVWKKKTPKNIYEIRKSIE